jgi:hypothetical protein
MIDRIMSKFATRYCQCNEVSFDTPGIPRKNKNPDIDRYRLHSRFFINNVKYRRAQSRYSRRS